MSLRSKTQKAKKFGTPTAPSVSAPKAPSPRATGGTPTAPSSTTAPTRPTTTRKTITPTPAGIAAQEGFKTQVQALTAPIRNVISELQIKYGSGDWQQIHTQAEIIAGFDEIRQEEQKIIDIEHELIEKELNANVNQIIQAINNGSVIIPDWFQNNINWVKSGVITQEQFLGTYYDLSNKGIIHAPIIEEVIEEIEVKETWWVIRPSGIIEQLTVTQKFKDTMTAQGWIFSKEKPSIEEPQNQNISIVFYIGKGGDLKTHFGINSIIVTPDEAEQLAKWLFQHYNTKILFVMNRLTDDIRTHTLQQIKDLIVQKLKDDKPDSDDIDDDDIKKPQELGFMGAGVAGAIAGLILIGFIADHKRGK